MIGLIVMVLLILTVTIFRTCISDYDKCYSRMEDVGIAVFGCCRGLVIGSQTPLRVHEDCIDCPYFVGLGKGGKL